jgi:hypothetical protein
MIQVPHIGDIAKRPAKQPTPGTLPENRIPVLDHRGRYRGHVGPNGISATVARFTKTHGAKLVEIDGSPAWVAPKPRSQRASNADAPNEKHASDLRAARGSVTTHPTKPQAHARPRR